jgi:hypothetical protein
MFPLTDELVGLVIPPHGEASWLIEKRGVIMFALRLGGGGYLVGVDSHHSRVCRTTDDLLSMAARFLQDLPPE